jgi:integrase
MYKTILSDVTPGAMRLFLNNLDMSPGGKYNVSIRLKAVFSRYVKDHRLNIPIDFDGIISKPKHNIKPEQWLNRQEVQKLLDMDLDGSLKDARDMFCLCCFTGMSSSDVLSFNKDKIKVINGREFIVFDRVKTGSKCKVPLLKEAREIIDSMNFPIKKKYRQYQYQVVALGEIIGRKISTHSGRKTAGDLFLSMGFSIESTSYFLGHSDIAITQKRYSRVTADKVENEMDRIGI